MNNIDKIKLLLNENKTLNKNINKYQDLIYDCKYKIKENINVLLDICPHNDIIEERLFSYQTLEYYRYCNICKCDINYEKFLKLKNYKITKI